MIYEESSVVHNLTIIHVLHVKIGFAKLLTIIFIKKFWLLNFDILFNLLYLYRNFSCKKINAALEWTRQFRTVIRKVKFYLQHAAKKQQSR